MTTHNEMPKTEAESEARRAAFVAEYAKRIDAVDAIRARMNDLMRGAALDERSLALRKRIVFHLIDSLVNGERLDGETAGILIDGVTRFSQYSVIARQSDEPDGTELGRIAMDALQLAFGIVAEATGDDPTSPDATITLPRTLEQEALAKLEAMERIYPAALANIEAGRHVELKSKPNPDAPVS